LRFVVAVIITIVALVVAAVVVFSSNAQAAPADLEAPSSSVR
jgi:hypothetical protein